MLPPLHGQGYPAGPRAPTSVGMAVRGRGAESPPRVVFGGAARLDSEADAGRHSRPTPSILITITVRVLVCGTPPATYVPARVRESFLRAYRRPYSGNGVGTGARSSGRAGGR